MFGASGGNSGVRTPLNTWQHNCLVWSGPQNKSLQAYVDGDLKSDLKYYTLEEERVLSEEGAIILGQYRQANGRNLFTTLCSGCDQSIQNISMEFENF